MTLSSSFWFCSRLKFELNYLLANLAEIWNKDQVWGADFEFELKNPIWVCCRQDKSHFLMKKNAPWQKHCHGNTQGYCGPKTLSNDALYNYNKSQKVSSAYCKLFGTARQKPLGATVNRINSIFESKYYG